MDSYTIDCGYIILARAWITNMYNTMQKIFHLHREIQMNLNWYKNKRSMFNILKKIYLKKIKR